MLEHQSLSEIYPEFVKIFPTLEGEIDSFLEGSGKKVVTLNTPVEEVRQCVEEMQSIAATIATTIVKGIRDGKIDPVSFFVDITKPAREVGEVKVGSSKQVGLMTSGKNTYHILEKVGNVKGKNSLLLLQRVPYEVDTEGEVHGIKKVRREKGENLVPDNKGGIEIYLPLTNDITFYVNDQIFKPKALEGLVTILPGDNHHHIRRQGQGPKGPKGPKGPARVFILAGCGFIKGTKTDKRFEVSKFKEIPRFTPLG